MTAMTRTPVFTGAVMDPDIGRSTSDSVPPSSETRCTCGVTDTGPSARLLLLTVTGRTPCSPSPSSSAEAASEWAEESVTESTPLGSATPGSPALRVTGSSQTLPGPVTGMSTVVSLSSTLRSVVPRTGMFTGETEAR